MLGLEPKMWRRLRMDVAAVSILETSHRHHGGTALALLNDTHHLNSAED
jgi:hypothetical protein